MLYKLASSEKRSRSEILKNRGDTDKPHPKLDNIKINNEFEVVKSLSYLGDVTHHTGCCFCATTACIRSDRKNFHDLLPILTNKSITL